MTWRPAFGRPGGLAAVGAIAAGALGWTYWRAIATAGPLTSDEASHALWGSVIAADLRATNLLGLAYDTYRHFYWPFLDSWLLAGAFLTFGSSTLVARGVSLAFFGALIVGLAGLGAQLRWDRSSRTCAAIVAAGLAGTCVALAIQAASVMLELPALFWLWLGLGLVILAHDRPPGYRDVAAGIALTAALLTKTNYGAVGLLVVGLDGLLELRHGDRRLAVRRGLLTLAPAVVCGAVLYGYPPKLLHTLQALANRPEGPPMWSPAGLAFFPLALLRMADWSAPLLLVALAISLGERRVRAVRLLLLVIGVQLALGTVSQTKLDRHVLPALPALFLLGARQASRAWGMVQSALAPRIGMAVAGLAIGLMSMRGLFPPSSQDLDASLGYVMTGLTADHTPTLVLGEFNELSAALVDWTRVEDGQPNAAFASNSLFGVNDDAEIERITAAAQRFGTGAAASVAGSIDRSTQRSLFHAEALNGALVTHGAASLPSLAQLLQQSRASRIVVVQLDGTSPLRGEDYAAYNAWMEPYAVAVQARTDVRLEHTFRGSDQGVSVLVYQRLS